MAVLNIYKFVGVDNNTTNGELNPFGAGNPLVSETYVIKSILVTLATRATVLIDVKALLVTVTLGVPADVTKIDLIT